MWHREYRPEWDGSPDNYAQAEIVEWGKSRRLGKYQSGNYKAYLGVQHIDPDAPGWATIVDEPQARFFVSIFVAGRCIALRTAPTMDAALDILHNALR
jgi:hypothetical protein